MSKVGNKLIQWFPFLFLKSRIVYFRYTLREQVFFREDPRLLTVSAQRFTTWENCFLIQYEVECGSSSRFWADESELHKDGGIQ